MKSNIVVVDAISTAVNAVAIDTIIIADDTVLVAAVDDNRDCC